MASKVTGLIEKFQIGSDAMQHIASTAYGYCETAAGTAAKTVDMTGFKLYEGVTIHIKFKYANSVANPTLNVQGTGAVPIVQYGTTAVSTTSETSGWQEGAILSLTYDGTSWVRDQGYNTNTWRGVENSLTSDSTTVSLSAAQGKALKGLIDAMDASTPAASGNATAFIDSLTQTDGKITSITKKNIPTASTSTAGIIKIGTTANDAAAGNHNHDSTYSYIHLTDYSFTATKPLSKYVTFDKSNPDGAPTASWYNGFISSHNNYLASYIINQHRTAHWYVGYGQFDTSTNTAPAPTWYLLAHSGNVSTGDNNGQVKIAGQNISVKGLKALAYKDSLTSADIPDNAANTTGNAATATTATNLSAKPSLTASGNNITVTAGGKTSDAFTVPYATDSKTSLHTSSKHISTLGSVSATNWIKVKIKKKTSWMLAFTIRIYEAYTYYDYVISGYNYGGSKWYSPQVVLLGSTTTDEKTVKFGYDDDADSNNYRTLWVAVPAGNYYGIDIVNVTNGYTQIMSDISSLFEIVIESTLSGTQQGNDVKVTRPIYRNEAPDLLAIEALTGTSGLLKKTAANTWALDTNTYLTSHRTYTAVSGKKPTGNQTPGFGSTFDIEQVGQDTTGQVSVTERTVTIPNTSASASVAGLVDTSAQEFAGIKTFRNGIEIKGHIAGDSSTTGHGLYSGGGYHNAYNNIILHGDASTGSSGIAFVSDKINASTGAVTTINQPSDRAFIQYHAHGITTTTAEGTAPTLATSGEAGRLVIGIGNDSGDKILLQAPGDTDIIHQIGATGYPIPRTTNTNGSVGGTTTPVYVDAGVIKACTAYANASVNYATSAGSATSATTATTATYIKSSDTRSTAIAPTDMTASQGVRFDFKAKETINLTATDAYAGVMSFRPYASGTDWSGGNAHQLAFNSEGLHWRNGSASWGNWYQILDSNNTSAANTNGAVISVARNTDTKIATINGIDIKIKIPASDNTWRPIGTGPNDAMAGNTTITNVTHTLGTTTKYYVTGSTTATTNTSGDTFDTGVYVTTTPGQLSATSYNINYDGNEKVTLKWNNTDSSLDFIFV